MEERLLVDSQKFEKKKMVMKNKRKKRENKLKIDFKSINYFYLLF